MDIRQCCDILDLSSQPTAEEIDRHYRDLVNVWHPDRFSGNPRLREKAAARLRPRPPADVLCKRPTRPLLCARVVRLAANLLHQRHEVAGVATTHRRAEANEARAADYVTCHCRSIWRPFTARSHYGAAPLTHRVHPRASRPDRSHSPVLPL